MSTRYVWEVYYASYEMTYTTQNHGDKLRVVTADEDYFIFGKSAAFSPSTGRYTLGGDIRTELASTSLLVPASYVYAASSSSSSTRTFSNVFWFSSTSGYWRTRSGGDGTVWLYADKDTRYYTQTAVKDELRGYVSSNNVNSYPNNGMSGSYWYDSLLAHNIDPQAVAIPSTINGGEAIMITVTESANQYLHTYGTIRYQYQYRLDGGSWTTLATTTETSQELLVPAGTDTVQVRVRVQDNLGFTSNDYVTSETVEVFTNQPPGAPGSISASNVTPGRYATISVTSATDTDGYIAEYVYERSADGGSWTRITSSGSLSCMDLVNSDWATVAYRAAAIDNNGAQGPYVTTQTYTLNSGYITISGPAEDLGDRRGPFGLSVLIGVSGEAGGSVTGINVTVQLDGATIYTGTRDAGEDLTTIIDTRFMLTGSHNILIMAEKGGLMSATAAFVFDIPVLNMDLINKAQAGLAQNPEAEALLPYTLAQLVIVDATGKTLHDVLDEMTADTPDEPTGTVLAAVSGHYSGTGVYGSSSPNRLTLGEGDLKLLVVAPSNSTTPGAQSGESTWMNPATSKPYLVWCGQSGTTDDYNNAVSVTGSDSSGTAVSWYSTSAAEQLNTSGTTYYYAAILERSAS